MASSCSKVYNILGMPNVSSTGIYHDVVVGELSLFALTVNLTFIFNAESYIVFDKSAKLVYHSIVVVRNLLGLTLLVSILLRNLYLSKAQQSARL